MPLLGSRRSELVRNAEWAAAMAQSPGEYSTRPPPLPSSTRLNAARSIPAMRLVVGLGNPGRDYAATRHNVGFMVVDELARRDGNVGFRRRFRADVGEGRYPGGKLILVKPQTYMNLSGNAVREAVNWYRVPREDILVVFDELDLPFGTIRLRPSGSAGGHNGMRSVLEQLGGTDIPRLRIGIGRGRAEAEDYVLSPFSREQAKELPFLIPTAADAVTTWATEGIIAAMNKHNA